MVSALGLDYLRTGLASGGLELAGRAPAQFAVSCFLRPWDLMPSSAPLSPPVGIAGQQRNERGRAVVWAAGGAGLVLAIGLVVRGGVADILRLLDIAGWALVWIVPLHIIPLALDAAGWRRLLVSMGIREGGASRVYLAWAAVVREAVSGLLPVARVGGEVAGVRLLVRRGIAAATAGASVVVELTVTMVAQLVFAISGLLLLLAYPAGNSVAARLATWGLLISAMAVAAFYLVQHRWGLFALLERALSAIVGGSVIRVVGDPTRLDAAIRTLYRDRRAVGACLGWQLAGLVAGAGELWVALKLLGHPTSGRSAIVLESLTMAVQSAMFLVPAGLGTQEGALVLFGAAVGLSPHLALALALVRRIRQLGLGLPALISWHWSERDTVRREHRAAERPVDHPVAAASRPGTAAW